MNSLILGDGEVGKALWTILVENYEVAVKDIGNDPVLLKNIEIMHVCFPYSDKFIDYVKQYQKQFKPKYTVIHSSVPVGTSRKIGAVHSPIRGLHPHLEQGIRTFVKFLGGKEASDVADYFRRAGLRVALFDKPETTEALKLFDTQYYLECVRFAQRVKKYCEKNELNFAEVYTLPNQTYNDGYTKLGMPEVVRPILQPIMREIGGHCLTPNEKLLKLSE